MIPQLAISDLVFQVLVNILSIYSSLIELGDGYSESSMFCSTTLYAKKEGQIPTINEKCMFKIATNLYNSLVECLSAIYKESEP